MKRIHWILAGLSLNIILLSLNRLTSFTSGYLQPFDFLRWLDFNAMLPVPLMAVLLYYLLKREIVYDHPFVKTGMYTLFSILIIAGIYFFAAGSGDHEVTNYLNSRFCDFGKTESPICNVIKFNDDEFSHIIYYMGFILMNVGLIGIEYNLPRKKVASKRDLLFISLNALFIGLGIFANLAFEPAGLDLIFFGSMTVLTLYLLLFGKPTFNQLPVIYYFGTSYTLGVIGTLLYKLIASS